MENIAAVIRSRVELQIKSQVALTAIGYAYQPISMIVCPVLAFLRLDVNRSMNMKSLLIDTSVGRTMLMAGVAIGYCWFIYAQKNRLNAVEA